MSNRVTEEHIERDSYELEVQEPRRRVAVFVLAILVPAGALMVILLGAPILRGRNFRALKYKNDAAAFVASGNFARAISMYERALALKPNDIAVRKLLARCRLQSGDLPEAIAEYHRCLRRKPDDTQTQLTLASLYLLAKDIDRPKEILDSLLEDEPDNVLALAMQAQCYYQRTDTPHPAVEVRMVTDVLPSTASPYNLPAGSEPVGQTPGEENELLQAVKNNPNEVQPHKNLADFYRLQKRFAEAEQQYKKMAEIAPRDPYVHLHLADFYRAEGVARFPEAIQQYSEILGAIESKNLFALRGISGLSIATGDLTAAKKYVDRLLWEQPRDAYGRYFRGILEIYDGDTDRAERDFLFVTREPFVAQEVSQYAHAHYLLGYTYLLNHAMGKSLESLERAAKVDPTYDRPRLLLAEIALNLGQYKRALDTIDNLLAIEKQKNNPLAYLVRGRIYLSRNDPARAATPFTKLAQLDKQSLYPGLLLGEVYKRTGKSDQAVAQYKAAIAADPKSPLPSYLLGLLYEKMGEPVLSLTNYEQAVKKAPNLVVADRSLATAYVRNSGGTSSADAKAVGETLLQRLPGNFTLLDTLATVFYERKQFDNAVTVLELIPQQERDARAHIVYHYAMALRDSARKAQALSHAASGKAARNAAEKAARRNAQARRELQKAARWLRNLPKADDVEQTLYQLIEARGIAQ